MQGTGLLVCLGLAHGVDHERTRLGTLVPVELDVADLVSVAVLDSHVVEVQHVSRRVGRALVGRDRSAGGVGTGTA